MILALLLAAGAPQPGELRTFGDWTVGCDNGRACQAVGLFPEPGFEGGSIALKRGAAAGAVPEIWVTARPKGEEEVVPAALVIDGQRFPLQADAERGAVPRDPAAVAARLGQATRIGLLDTKGAEIAIVSVRGSAAALLYMDEQQRRLGTTGALVRRGPATAVTSPPALPVITRPPSPSKPARNLGKARVRQLLGRDATVCDYPHDFDHDAVRLDARHSLILAGHPCGNGAYNMISSAFIVDESGRARPARFDTDRAREEGLNGLVNAGWDAENRTLTSFAKGRGLGDCGVGQDFAWDGTMFRLIRQYQMGECRGSLDYITTWRAEAR